MKSRSVGIKVDSLLRGPLDIRLLLLDVARIPRGSLDLIDHLIGELAAGLRAQCFT